MVDDRYAKNQRYINSLSKWVRSDVIHHSSFNQMMYKLEPFVKDMIALDNENRMIAEIEDTVDNVQKNFLHKNSSSEKKDSKSQKNRNTSNRYKRKQTIEYESDSSNDAVEASNRISNGESRENVSSKLKTKMELNNHASRPNLGSFPGPKDRSEFFSKGPKSNGTQSKPRAGTNRKKNTICVF